MAPLIAQWAEAKWSLANARTRRELRLLQALVPRRAIEIWQVVVAHQAHEEERRRRGGGVDEEVA